MSQETYMPRSKQDQVETLYRMFEAPVQYDERLRMASQEQLLRIVEEPLIQQWYCKPAPPALELLRLRNAHRRMQMEVCRGLRIAGVVLTVLSVWAATLHSTGLTLLLGALAFTCLPLYLLAQPVQTEVR